MSFVAVAVAGVAVAGTVYSADQQRKAVHKQADALRMAEEADARNKAEAETQAQVAAGEARVATNRRRRNNALALGDPTGTADTLGAASGASVASTPATTALGSGAK